MKILNVDVLMYFVLCFSKTNTKQYQNICLFSSEIIIPGVWWLLLYVNFLRGGCPESWNIAGCLGEESQGEVSILTVQTEWRWSYQSRWNHPVIEGMSQREQRKADVLWAWTFMFSCPQTLVLLGIRLRLGLTPSASGLSGSQARSESHHQLS